MALALLGSCAAAPARPGSIWPPEDFYVEVWLGYGGQEQARARFWADGFAVYAEASDWIGGGDPGSAPIPVFSRICAYQMGAKSIREFSRLLDRAGLLEIEADQGGRFEQGMTTVRVHWRAFEGRGAVWTTVPVDASMTRVLHVLNAFLPEHSAFDLEGLTGEREPRHLLEVPEPSSSVEGALELYSERLVARDPTNTSILLDAFGLAVAAGNRDVGTRVLRDIELAIAADEPAAWWSLPGSGSQDLGAMLRGILDALPR